MARYSTTALLSLILAVVFLADLVVATLVNITVDDSDTQAITYIPTTAHWARASSSPNQPCNSCLEHPTNASGQTWHEATYNSINPLQNIAQTATFIFDGSAIYVFGIISHNHNNTVRDMDIFFYIDDHMVGNFKDSPPANPDGGIVYDYNVVLYANPSISQPGSHNFTLQNGQPDGSSSLILFDYIIYTSDVADQTISNAQALTQTSVSTSPLASSASIPSFSTPNSSSSARNSSSSTSHSSSSSSPSSSSSTSTTPTTPADLSSSGRTISKHILTIIIVSAIVGGVFIIILLAIIFVLYRSRANAQRKLLEVKPWVPMPAPPALEAPADQETPVHALVIRPQEKQSRGAGALETEDGEDAREDHSGVSEALNLSNSPPGSSTPSLQPERVQDNFASAENSSDITPSEGPPPYSSRHTSSTRS
ncbi:hypothetical protein PHLCEN_2v383 [Hermanssonia centrifuga]|uniref:Uncharacterized protein n=1 Tax=Hermanssonia centrifuga TaxID=98765 RepID=A0A2R6S688_9APHY|nr:hypothetical protein PHLCEN_2v383 [Hermanssonia centrifuga]